MKYTALANAKLNLSLDIVSKRDDGYHNMKTVMQSVSLSDEITAECVPGKGVVVETGLPYLPGDERNIAVKSALAFFKYTGIDGYHTHIRINKKIPVCAGLGGGSADCACVLRMLNRMFDAGIGKKELETIGGRIGADVPFCINGGTMLAIDRGDVLTELSPIPKCSVVICKPPFSCSTPELFGRVRCEKIRARPDAEGIVAALENGDLKGIAQRMYNVFEDILPRGARDIAEIKYAMNDHGALGASMTGSGPTVFGLFDDEDKARAAYEYLKMNFRECFLAETTGKEEWR
jgi:4-diphosphocytidyl-2-C-methyl-D-erythritol kinase